MDELDVQVVHRGDWLADQLDHVEIAITGIMHAQQGVYAGMDQFGRAAVGTTVEVEAQLRQAAQLEAAIRRLVADPDLVRRADAVPSLVLVHGDGHVEITSLKTVID